MFENRRTFEAIISKGGRISSLHWISCLSVTEPAVHERIQNIIVLGASTRARQRSEFGARPEQLSGNLNK